MVMRRPADGESFDDTELTGSDELTSPQLPGFTVTVASLFHSRLRSRDRSRPRSVRTIGRGWIEARLESTQRLESRAISSSAGG